MSDEIIVQKYGKLSIASIITGMLAVSFCVLYFISWALFDNFLTSFVAGYKFMPYVLFLYVCAGVCLTITAVITGSIDLSRIKTGTYNYTGKGFGITGIVLGSLLILFGLILWFVDFFGFVNIIT